MAQQTKCRKKTEARREAILDAALEEFAAKGYAGARMEDHTDYSGGNPRDAAPLQPGRAV